MVLTHLECKSVDKNIFNYCKVPLFWGKLVQSTAHLSRPGGLVGIHTQS